MVYAGSQIEVKTTLLGLQETEEESSYVLDKAGLFRRIFFSTLPRHGAPQFPDLTCKELDQNDNPDKPEPPSFSFGKRLPSQVPLESRARKSL